MEGWFSWAGYVSTKFLCIYGRIHSVFLHSSANWVLVPWSDSLLHSACLKWSFWGVASVGSQGWLWRMNWSNQALCVMMSWLLVTILVELFAICWISKHERWKFECQHFLTVGQIGACLTSDCDLIKWVSCVSPSQWLLNTLYSGCTHCYSLS